MLLSNRKLTTQKQGRTQMAFLALILSIKKLADHLEVLREGSLII